MIKRKELTNYTNSIKENIFEIYDNKKHRLSNEYLSLDAIKSLCDCSLAKRKGKEANFKSFGLSNNAVEQYYDYNFEVFIKDSVEYHLAMAYIQLIAYGWIHGMEISFERSKSIDFIRFDSADCITIIVSELQFEEHPKMEKIINQMLFLIELLCRQWKIDLHSIVDQTIKYIQVNNKYKIHEV